MFNVIGINTDGSERDLVTGFSTWFLAFDWIAANAHLGEAIWYRIDRYIGPAVTA